MSETLNYTMYTLEGEWKTGNKIHYDYAADKEGATKWFNTLMRNPAVAKLAVIEHAVTKVSTPIISSEAK